MVKTGHKLFVFSGYLCVTFWGQLISRVDYLNIINLTTLFFGVRLKGIEVNNNIMTVIQVRKSAYPFQSGLKKMIFYLPFFHLIILYVNLCKWAWTIAKITKKHQFMKLQTLLYLNMQLKIKKQKFICPQKVHFSKNGWIAWSLFLRHDHSWSHTWPVGHVCDQFQS